MKGWMMWACGPLIVAAIVLASTGAVSAWVLLMGAGCALMMGMMGWMMIGMVRGGGGD